MTYVGEIISLGLFFCLVYIIVVHMFFRERDPKLHNRRLSMAPQKSENLWREKTAKEIIPVELEVKEAGGNPRYDRPKT